MRSAFRNWFWPVIIGILALWAVAGAPPFGPFDHNNGFGTDWDCVQNPGAGEMCIKRATVNPAAP